jgi:adenylate cyclase
MVRIVQAHGGNMDKFIGDAIMAFFGAPIPRYDHSVQAVLCAIAMQEECTRFREDTGVEFYMRIGIHSGEMIAGSIGAEKARFLNFTMIGDDVNLASRLEGKNKEFGSWIMCSAETFEAARSLVEGESARANIKGKAKDVEVYIVRGLKGHPEQSNHWGHQLPAAPGAALPHERQRDSFGDSQEPLALPAPVEVNEGKSL